MSRHVVFGTGQIGRLVAERLVSLGADVTAVNRSGRGSVTGAQVVAGDTAFRTAFGALATPLDDALATTTAWYRDAGSASRAPASREPNPSSAA